MGLAYGCMTIIMAYLVVRFHIELILLVMRN